MRGGFQAREKARKQVCDKIRAKFLFQSQSVAAPLKPT